MNDEFETRSGERRRPFPGLRFHKPSRRFLAEFGCRRHYWPSGTTCTRVSRWRRRATYSLVCTCGLLGIEPWAYLKDVLQRLAERTDPASLTPRLWHAAQTAR